MTKKLGHMQTSLRKWSSKSFGSVLKRFKEIREEIARLLSGVVNSETENKVRKLSAELDEILYREEIMWKQRSRVTWLKEGYKNTNFFHRQATWRQKKNTISKLKDESGVWVDDMDGMKNMATDFFLSLYSEDLTVRPDLLLNFVQSRVTEDMNASLVKEFTDKEIADAMFQIGPLKAPGPNGFLARFFQKNRSIVKEDVIKAVRIFFETGVMPKGVNDTMICLIPKGKDPQTVKDYRSISLCNVVYKVVSKCLVNRLRPFLEEIISETQSTFIPGRMITDNAIITFECFHKIQHSRNANNNHCAYKLDLAKAYDRVDWRFLEGVLRKFGFSETWVGWIMSCLKSVRYAIKWNG